MRTLVYEDIFPPTKLVLMLKQQKNNKEPNWVGKADATEFRKTQFMYNERKPKPNPKRDSRASY